MYYPVGTTFRHESGICHSIVALKPRKKVVMKRLNDGETKVINREKIVERVQAGELEQL